MKTIKTFLFQHVPLKAINQPEQFGLLLTSDGPAQQGWQDHNPQTIPLTESVLTESYSDAASYLQATKAARHQLLNLLQISSSQPSDVESGLRTYLGLLLDLVQAGQHAQQPAAQLPPSPNGSAPASSLTAVLQFMWHDVLVPLAAMRHDSITTCSSSSTSSSHSSGISKWFGPAARQKSATSAAADSAPDAHPMDVVQEAASMLLSVATWQLAKAAELGSAEGSPDDSAAAAMEAYKFYCCAAGVLVELQKQLLPQLLAGGSNGADLQPHVLTALQHFALAEAQSLMLQRAVAMNYQGSSIAGMATDTAVLYAQCFSVLQAAAEALQLPWSSPPSTPSAAAAGPAAAATATWPANDQDLQQQKDQNQKDQGSVSGSATATDSSTPAAAAAKSSRMQQLEQVLTASLPTSWPLPALRLVRLAAYVKYQVGHLYCLAALCAAETALSKNEAGKAVRLAHLGEDLMDGLKVLGRELSTLLDVDTTGEEQDNSRRLALEGQMQDKTLAVLKRCVKENSTFYMQYVPDQPPNLALPQRTAQPEPYKLPAAAARLTPASATALLAAAASGCTNSAAQSLGFHVGATSSGGSSGVKPGGGDLPAAAAQIDLTDAAHSNSHSTSTASGTSPGQQAAVQQQGDGAAEVPLGMPAAAAVAACAAAVAATASTAGTEAAEHSSTMQGTPDAAAAAAPAAVAATNAGVKQQQQQMANAAAAGAATADKREQRASDSGSYSLGVGAAEPTDPGAAVTWSSSITADDEDAVGAAAATKGEEVSCKRHSSSGQETVSSPVSGPVSSPLSSSNRRSSYGTESDYSSSRAAGKHSSGGWCLFACFRPAAKHDADVLSDDWDMFAGGARTSDAGQKQKHGERWSDASSRRTSVHQG